MIKSIVTQSLGSSNATPIAYFCPEYAVTFDESMYAGGLGVLAGDFLFEAGDEKMPFIALGLKYAKTKIIKDGFELLTESDGKPVIVEVPIGMGIGVKKIFLQSWVKRFGGKTFLLLLDPDVSNNAPEDRVFGDLYDQDFTTRLKQEICLGIGGFRLLKTLGIEPSRYHLNEGNLAFAALAVLAEGFPESQQNHDELLKAVRSKVVLTKHTILSVGTRTQAEELWKVIGTYCETYGIDKDFIMSLGAFQGDKTLFSNTYFLLNLSGRSNGVSVTHTVFEKQKYPNSQLIPITNGVYIPRWQSTRWLEKGFVSNLSPKEIWAIKNGLRRELIQKVHELSGVELNPDVCTLVWTRRFVEYKRPLAIFTDMQRLKSILFNDSRPLQIIISGKVAGAGPENISMMNKVRSVALDPMFKGKIAFVPGYSLDVAQKFVSGSDIWLNTPKRGIEACGTSGMKAGLNGALMVSVSDGWMDEVDWNGIGWILLDDDKALANSLYDVLEQQILPEFYNRNADGVSESWTKRMLATMNVVAKDFSAAKMIQTYKEKLYS